MQSDEKEDLVFLLRRSFDGNTLPENDPIIVGIPSDYNDPDYSVVSHFFSGRDWRSLSPIDLQYFQSLISTFNDRAFAYFLPAFLLAALDNEYGQYFEHHLLFLLNPYNYDNLEDFKNRFVNFKIHQMNAIREFIYFILKYDDDLVLITGIDSMLLYWSISL